MYPQEYIDFLVHFHGDRDFFECHEILEGYWKNAENPQKNSTLVGLILLAVSSYHHRRGNLSGAQKTLKKALQIFHIDQQDLRNYGFQPEEFIESIVERLRQIQAKNIFSNFNLPIRDRQLIDICKQSCIKRGFKWGEGGRLSDEIIHRHKTRDRTSIIIEREMALKNRKKKGRES